MKAQFHLFCISVLLFFTSCSSSLPEQGAVESIPGEAGQLTRIEMGDLFTMKSSDKIFLIDCRPKLFYRIGHIDGAESFPYKSFESNLLDMKPALDAAARAGKVIVVYCQNTKCPDAYKTAKELSYLGYSVSIYHGGWDEWRRAGLSSL